MWSRIDRNRVVEITDTDPAGRYVPEWVWVECGSDVRQGWSYLAGVFSAPAPPIPSKADLAAYANAHQWALATGGYTVSVAGTALLWATDDLSQLLITGKAVRIMQAGAPATVSWQFATGFVTMTAAQFVAAAIQIADFVQSTFAALQTVLAAIVAGTITTMTQVDASSWPAPASLPAA